MKKNFTILLAVIFFLPAFAAKPRRQKVRIEKIEPDSTTEAYVGYRVKANHWSIMGNVGVGIFDGDQSQKFNAIWPRSKADLSFNVNVEYTVNPIWGIYANYFFNPYRGKIDGKKHTWYNVHNGETATYDFDGMAHEATLGVSLNMLNLFYRCRRQTWNWYMNAGTGLSFYTVDADSLHSIKGDNGKKGRSMVFTFGSNLEYAPTDWLAILLNVQYNIHRQDSYDGFVSGNTNDNMFYAGIGLRWNINSVKYKNRNHVRNMSMCQFEPEIGAEMARRNQKRIDAMEPRIDSLEEGLKDLTPRVEALENDMDNVRDEDGDGVPDIRDRHPNTPKDTPVNSFGEPIDAAADNGTNAGVGQNNDENHRPVYFATGKANLDDAAHAELAKVAQRMYNHSEYKLEIHGYCDEQGEKQHFNNQRLSERRAENIKKALVKKYGVEAGRIVMVKGHGAISGPSIDYMPNRRGDMILVTK